MVISYLNRLHDEYIGEQLDLEKKIHNLNIHLRENTEFIKLLDQTNDPTYESFTPWDVNVKNKKKIQELMEEQQKIKESLEEAREHYAASQRKIEELTAVISQAKKQLTLDESDCDDEVFRITMLETQENERQRISRELHDSTAQNLTSLVHKTEFCIKLVEEDPIRCKLELNKVSKMIREIINDTRELIYNLRPMSFDDIGLDIAIERALDKLESSESRKIDFTVEGEPYSIKSVIGITLLRIIQEGCSNAVRHGNASIIQVLLKYEDDKISVKIEDDGSGFDTKSIEQNSRDDNSGFGLSMMKERVYLLSGNITIDSDIHCGTKINVEVPIKKKEGV